MSRLHFASSRGLLAEVHAAIEEGVPLEERTKDDFTALHLAAREGYGEIVRVLLRAGAEATAVHRNGRTALHFAASSGHLNVVQILVEHGVPVDILGHCGETPALEAAELNRREVVRYLIERGADPNASGRRERSVEEWLAVGGIQGLTATRWPNLKRPDRFLASVQRMMREVSCVEEYAALHGRSFLLYSLDHEEYTDPEVSRWTKRLGEIIRSPEALIECEERFLTGEALLAKRQLRDRQRRAASRREERERTREERKLDLT